jgi:alcohol dehydrogenase class IV
MVRPFQFARIPKIHFKNGVISELPGFIKFYNGKIVLVTGQNSFINSKKAHIFLASLHEMNIGYKLITVSDEPSPELIDSVIKYIDNDDVKAVVGIGGGSVLDAGKAISAMMYRTESVMEFLEGVGTKDHPGTKLPFIAVPTTSGTGSEATKNAVISKTPSFNDR